MTASTCSTCGAPIEWARTIKAGKAIPLDSGTYANGNLEVVRRDDDGTPCVRVVPIAERRELARQLRRSHFATCPQADEHRR